MSYQELVENVIGWGQAKGLHTPDLQPQFVKLTEELGELAAGIARNDKSRIMDAVGDMQVVLVNFGACFAKALYPSDIEEQLRTEKYFMEATLNIAWKQIKDRTGHTRDGVFVKDEGE